VVHGCSEDVLAEFAHELRQPLSAMEALTSYLDLIVASEDTRVREQLRRMHLEIDHADQIIREGVRTLRAYLSAHNHSALGDVAATVPPESVAEELSRPLTNAAMASVAY